MYVKQIKGLNMNVDLKLGCYYTLSVSFGMTEIKVQDWTLDETINSLIK